MAVVTRRLEGESDVAVLRDLRLEALRVAPLSFGVTLAEAEAYSHADWLKRMETPVFASFLDGKPVGLAAVGHDVSPSHRHRASLYMVFVRAEARGQGVADHLVDFCCAWAKAQGFLQVELIVTKGNEAAHRVYLRNGFVDYGLLPRGRRIGETFIDDVMMVRMLD